MGIFDSVDNVVIARSQSKQAMADAMRRLGRIRRSCGEKDDDEVTSNDPLLRCIYRFERRVETAQDLLGADDLSENDKLLIRRSVMGATAELHDLELMFLKADAVYNTAVLKQKAEKKVAPLEAERDRCKLAFDQAHETLDEVRRTQADQAARDSEKLEKQRKKGKVNEEMIKREPMTAADGGKAEKKNLGRAISILAKSQSMIDQDRSENEDADMASAVAAGFSLSGDASTRTQAIKIKEQKREVRESLSRIEQGVRRLHEMSKVMAHEIEDQSKRVEHLGDVVEQRTEKLQDLNNRLDELHQSLKPMNTCFNLICFMVLVGIVGFLLTYYKVVEI